MNKLEATGGRLKTKIPHSDFRDSSDKKISGANIFLQLKKLLFFKMFKEEDELFS